MKRVHRLAISGLVLLAGVLSGCAGATRLPMRTKGPAGEALQTKKLDLAFLDVPGTQREEVLSRLGRVDTSYSNPRLFWARWSESKWGYWWFVAAQTGGAGDAKRIWHVHNLLVSFDQDGVVQKKELFNGDKCLWLELHSRLAEATPLDLTQQMQIEVLGPGKLQRITLGKDSIGFDLPRAKRAHFEVSPKAIVRISHNWVPGAHSAVTCHTLHLAEKGPAGKRISFCVSPSDIASAFQYLGQYGSPLLRWD